jgi:hypothetical protein
MKSSQFVESDSGRSPMDISYTVSDLNWPQLDQLDNLDRRFVHSEIGLVQLDIVDSSTVAVDPDTDPEHIDCTQLGLTDCSIDLLGKTDTQTDQLHSDRHLKDNLGTLWCWSATDRYPLGMDCTMTVPMKDCSFPAHTTDSSTVRSATDRIPVDIADSWWKPAGPSIVQLDILDIGLDLGWQCKYPESTADTPTAHSDSDTDQLDMPNTGQYHWIGCNFPHNIVYRPTVQGRHQSLQLDNLDRGTGQVETDTDQLDSRSMWSKR